MRKIPPYEEDRPFGAVTRVADFLPSPQRLLYGETLDICAMTLELPSVLAQQIAAESERLHLSPHQLIVRCVTEHLALPTDP